MSERHQPPEISSRKGCLPAWVRILWIVTGALFLSIVLLVMVIRWTDNFSMGCDEAASRAFFAVLWYLILLDFCLFVPAATLSLYHFVRREIEGDD